MDGHLKLAVSPNLASSNTARVNNYQSKYAAAYRIKAGRFP